MKPFFSVIIPVFNVENYLHQCLDSVFNQDFYSFEVIAVNDGSTDNSASILIEFLEKYKNFKIISQLNSGLPSARNAGLIQAVGNYIVFLDSDDFLTENFFKILYQYCLENHDLIQFTPNYIKKGTPPEIINFSKFYNSGIRYYVENKSGVHGSFFGVVWTRIYNRTFLLKHNLLFDDLQIFHEDELFTLQVTFYAKNILIIPFSLYNYRIRQGSIMENNSKLLQRILFTVRLGNKIAEFVKDKNFEQNFFYFKIIRQNYIESLKHLREWDLMQFESEVISKIDWQNFKFISVSMKDKILDFLLEKNYNFYLIYKKFASLLLKFSFK